MGLRQCLGPYPSLPGARSGYLPVAGLLDWSDPPPSWLRDAPDALAVRGTTQGTYAFLIATYTFLMAQK